MKEQCQNCEWWWIWACYNGTERKQCGDCCHPKCPIKDAVTWKTYWCPHWETIKEKE